MSCNSCAKPYSLLRKEKGCPACGFSYCSKCLKETIFVKKLNRETTVCTKCKVNKSQLNESQTVQPPDAYYKRLADSGNKNVNSNNIIRMNPETSAKGPNKDHEILDRLKKLKEYSKNAKQSSTEEIEKRLQNIKEKLPKITDEDLQERLARLRGIPAPDTKKKTTVCAPDLRTEQEQADDLMKEYSEKVTMESKYEDQFDTLVSDIETRLGNLKTSAPGSSKETVKKEELPELDGEEEMLKKILAKVKAEINDDDELPPSSNDELPFCEICNEDATVRCLGCRYLFCQQCFNEHKDDDDGCNSYELYKPSKCLDY